MLVAALGFIAAPAEAGWKLDRAKAIADVVWHHPCGDVPVEVVWEPLEATIAAQVHDDEAPPYPLCRIHFNSDERLGWMAFCSYMLHETGHLANFRDPLNVGPGWSETEHSHNPDSIMATFFNDDARGRKRGRPYLERHGLL
jgi:hypothetical protein